MFKKRSFLALFASTSLFFTSQAQESPFSVGVHMDWSMESPSFEKYIGVQGKYDLTERQSLQAQLGGSTYDVRYIGVDYLYTVFPLKRMPSVFVGGGVAYEKLAGTSYDDITFNGQAGMQFDIGRFSPYVGYKARFFFEAEGIDPSYLMLGLRFRL